MPVKDENWAERQEAIAAILDDVEIKRQCDLLAQLRDRGFNVTQSSVSRDLTEMGAVKVAGRYIVAPKGTQPSSGLGEMGQALVGFDTAGANLMVVHTRPGRASLVALAMDRAKWGEVVGTVAGDDTVFVATSGRRPQVVLELRLMALMGDAQQ